MSHRNTTAETQFLPIEEYGVIGNDNRCALVGSDGSIDWCCFPHLESPSVFAAVLDPDVGGRFAIRPDAPYDSSQAYVDRTNVLETTFETNGGMVTVTDFMPVRNDDAPDEPFQQSIYRKITGVEGTVDVDVRFEPRFDYARAETTLAADDGDVVATVSDGAGVAQRPLYVHADLDFAIDAERAAATTTVPIDAGDEHWLTVRYAQRDERSDDERAAILEETVDYWRSWLDVCEDSAAAFFDFESAWRDVLQRSALVLKLLIHDETGSIPAAPTTSLPEEIGCELNWDYRYNWIRDAKFTVQALHSVGQTDEAHRYFEWFRAIAADDPADLRPLYGLHGETELEEETLDHLSGYRDSTPVRVGNAAADQVQLDIYGTIIQGIYETIRYDGDLAEDDWHSICALAEHVCEHWDERGKGIWEFRDLHVHYVHSKLLCWVALDRALRLADEFDRDAPFERWKDVRAEIREAIETRGYDEELGSFVQYFDADEALDATALLIPLYDFLPADDERVQNTIDTVLEELTTDDGLVFRFANSDARPREPGGFVICSFWLVDALALSGRVEEAERVFESLLDHTSSLGLLSEMIHAEDGTFLGNHPQAYSHIGLLNSVLYLTSAKNGDDSISPEEFSDASAPMFQRDER